MRKILPLLYLLFLAAPLLAQEADKPVGTRMHWEILLVMLGVLYAIFRIFDYRIKKDDGDDEPAPPPPPRASSSSSSPPPMPKPSAAPVKAKSLDQQITEAFGDLKEVGKNTYFTGGILGKGGDTERYVAVAKIDKGYIRDEERAKANANYEMFRQRITLLRSALILMTAQVFLLTFEFWIIAVKALISLVKLLSDKF